MKRMNNVAVWQFETAAESMCVSATISFYSHKPQLLSTLHFMYNIVFLLYSGGTNTLFIYLVGFTGQWTLDTGHGIKIDSDIDI